MNFHALINQLGIASEVIGSIIIATFCMRATAQLLWTHDVSQPQRLIADGAIFGLTWKTAAALCQTIVLASWQSIGMFAAILALRIVLKKIFTWELRFALEKQSLFEGTPD